MQSTTVHQHRATETVLARMNRTSFTTAASRSDANCAALLPFPFDTLRIFSDLIFDSSVALLFTSKFHCLSVTSGGLRCFKSIILFNRNRWLVKHLFAFFAIQAWSTLCRWPSPLTSHPANTNNHVSAFANNLRTSDIQHVSVNHGPLHLQHACCHRGRPLVTKDIVGRLHEHPWTYVDVSIDISVHLVTSSWTSVDVSVDICGHQQTSLCTSGTSPSTSLDTLNCKPRSKNRPIHSRGRGRGITTLVFVEFHINSALISEAPSDTQHNVIRFHPPLWI